MNEMYKLKGQQDLADLDLDDLDELIAKLTPEEIEQLENEVDPDVCL